MKTKKRILWITQTAMLLGLTVAAQYYLTGVLGFNQYASQLVVGSLVNMFLILATLMCGFFSGFSISVLAPFISLLINRMPHPWMIPFVALGNLTLVFVFWMICESKLLGKIFSVNWAAASVIGSFLKFGVLWLGVTKIFVNFILKNDTALPAQKISNITALVSFNYSFPQLTTALIGCVLVYAIYPAITKVAGGKISNDKTIKR